VFTKNDEEPQCADAVWAKYHCRYDWRDRRVKDIRQGVFYPTRFAAPQVTLPPLTPQDSLVIYRARAKRQVPMQPPTPPLLLFEVVPTACANRVRTLFTSVRNEADRVGPTSLIGLTQVGSLALRAHSYA
jgi:hypothetical protein